MKGSSWTHRRRRLRYLLYYSGLRCLVILYKLVDSELDFEEFLEPKKVGRFTDLLFNLTQP